MLDWLSTFTTDRRELRIQQTSALLARHGYRTSRPSANVLEPFLPWSFAHPDECHVHAVAQPEPDTAVHVYEYGYSYRDSEGSTQYADEVVVMAHHPRITGGAVIAMDAPAWGGAAAVVDALSWLPPFVIARGIAWALASVFGQPASYADLEVGHAEFDRLYKVHAADPETARRAIRPALREHLVHTGFRGTIELREQWMLYTVAGASFSPTRVGIALTPLAGILAAAREPSPHPYR